MCTRPTKQAVGTVKGKKKKKKKKNRGLITMSIWRDTD